MNDSTNTFYDRNEIEVRWRTRWDKDYIWDIDIEHVTADEKFYSLVEFPYPSAEGLHVGHVYTYCGADTFSRYYRMHGKKVFQPMGFDSFGIHSENFALRAGVHPQTLTARTIEHYREQLKLMGAVWNWRYEIATSDPDYYRWTQWIFLQLYRAGLAVRKEAPVVWCPSCKTVLANEQLEGDRCERCSTQVTQKFMKQWFLRITVYADALLEGLADLDWPDLSKNLQGEWIGRSQGGEVDSYRMHDWLISRQRYWGPPIPIIYCSTCGIVPVPEEQLPVMLPYVEDFRPTGTDMSPLAAVESFVHVTCPQCGEPAQRETDVSDAFFDSSWYFLRYPSSDIKDKPWDLERTARLLPVDVYFGGKEHIMRHHLYARFVTMALHDLGHLPFAEAFPHLRLHGLLIKDGFKMSKSRGNVVNPDEYIAQYGADNLRMYLLFCGPWEEGGDFSDKGLIGIERFNSRVWSLVTARHQPGTGGVDLRMLDRSIKKVQENIERLKFNIAISGLMELVRWARAEKSNMSVEEWQYTSRTLVLLLAPFAPYLAEELWLRIGGDYSVHMQSWPDYNEQAVHESTINLVIQINGKVRDVCTVPLGLDQAEAEAIAFASEKVSQQLNGRHPHKTIFVPDRLINLLV